MPFWAIGLGLAVAGASFADITGAMTVDYSITAEDFGGVMVSVNVSDLYLTSNDAADTALNVYNMTMAAAGQVTSLPELHRYRLVPEQPRCTLRYPSSPTR